VSLLLLSGSLFRLRRKALQVKKKREEGREFGPGREDLDLQKEMIRGKKLVLPGVRGEPRLRSSRQRKGGEKKLEKGLAPGVAQGESSACSSKEDPH